MDDNRNIYLGADGNYHDRTDENLAQFPPLETNPDSDVDAGLAPLQAEGDTPAEAASEAPAKGKAKA